MKCSAAVAAFTMAIAAIAAPTEIETKAGLEARTGGTTTTCSAVGQQQVCCNGLLGCLIQVLGANCQSGAYCCETNNGDGININLLTCIKLL